MRVHTLPYLADGERFFAALRQLPWAIWLDSGGGGLRFGSHDIFVAAPRETLVTTDGVSVLTDGNGSRRVLQEPLSLLQQRLERGAGRERVDLPFAGGAVGYFGYDLGMRLEGVDDPRPASGVPELAVGFYDWAVVTDHRRRETAWVGPAEALPMLERIRALMRTSAVATQFRAEGALIQPDWDDYRQAFEKVQQYIHAGDCYQVNLARPFAVAYSGDPWEAYRRLRRISPAPFGAYLQLPFAQILSNSPERFLVVRDGRVETRPIKGTRPRHEDPVLDAQAREALRNSDKDRAENVMIVDLMRNDLGKSCRIGSVRTSELFNVETFACVHHLVSAVTGELAEGVTAADLLRGCLPGGSITGAPKRRAMEIIRELEPQPRGVYCGAIGYLGYDGSMDTSIAIRTAVCAQGRATYWAGGGLVADSTAAAEFAEIHDKAAAFLRMIAASRG